MQLLLMVQVMKKMQGVVDRHQAERRFRPEKARRSVPGASPSRRRSRG